MDRITSDDFDSLGGEAQEFSGEESKSPRGRCVRHWLALFAVFFVVVALIRAGGDALYNPPSRLPQSFSYEQNLLGATEGILTDLRLFEQRFPPGKPVALVVTGDAYRIEFPRTFADRLFGERREDVTVFTAKTLAGDEYRFLVMSGDGRRVFAAESPRVIGRGDSPAGMFIVLPQAEHYLGVIASLEALWEKLPDESITGRSHRGYSVFGPFANGDRTALQRRLAQNPVLSHLIEALDGNRADVSLTAPMILVSRSPARGSIRALYQPDFGVVLEPPWGESTTSTLAHELVHAYLDEVAKRTEEKLARAVTYLEGAHPKFFGETMKESYPQLNDSRRAEEALANLVGALASRRLRTVDVEVALGNEEVAENSEPVLISDVELLLEFELLPECMDPDESGFTDKVVTFAYYDLVAAHCSR